MKTRSAASVPLDTTAWSGNPWNRDIMHNEKYQEMKPGHIYKL